MKGRSFSAITEDMESLEFVMENYSAAEQINTMASALRCVQKLSTVFFNENVELTDDGQLQEAFDLQKKIQNFLLSCHYRWKNYNETKSNPSYEDVCSALLSFVMDLHVVRASIKNNVSSSSVMSSLFIILEHSPTHIFDVLLQTSTTVKKYHSQWEDILRKLLWKPHAAGMSKSCTVYLKYLLSVKKWMLMSPRYDGKIVENATLNYPSPPEFLKWFKIVSVNCDRLDLSSCNSDRDLIKLLLISDKVNEEVIGILLQFVNSNRDAFHESESSNVEMKNSDGVDRVFFIDKTSVDDYGNVKEFSKTDEFFEVESVAAGKEQSDNRPETDDRGSDLDDQVTEHTRTDVDGDTKRKTSDSVKRKKSGKIVASPTRMKRNKKSPEVESRIRRKAASPIGNKKCKVKSDDMWKNDNRRETKSSAKKKVTTRRNDAKLTTTTPPPVKNAKSTTGYGLRSRKSTTKS